MELATRMRADPAFRSKMVEQALAVQGDPAEPWDTRWGAMVEQAFQDKLPSVEQWDRYVEQAVRLEVKVAPYVHHGQPLPITALCSELRSYQRLFHCELCVEIGQPGQREDVRVDGWLEQGCITWGPGDLPVFPARVLEGLPTGPQELTVHVTGDIITKGTTVPVNVTQQVRVTILP
jgi:hypothetical protein